MGILKKPEEESKSVKSEGKSDLTEQYVNLLDDVMESAVDSTEMEDPLHKLAADSEVLELDQPWKVQELKHRVHDLGPEYFETPSINAKIQPFKLAWAFGIGKQVSFLNLSTVEEGFKIFYPASHMAILYKHKNKTMNFFQGHQNIIVSVSTTLDGRWLATADSGPDNIIMMWDSTDFMPVRTFFNPYGETGKITCVAISPSGKFLISLGDNDGCQLDVWMWTTGEDNPNDSRKIKGNLGKPLSVKFHPDKEEHIMVVFEKGVTFITWDFTTEQLSEPDIQFVKQRNKTGHITDGTYISKCHETMVSTVGGCVVIFGTSFHVKRYDECPLDNNKMYIKTIKLSHYPINCITSADGMVVTGDNKGKILFFDQRLKLLYWIMRPDEIPIRRIKFNLDMRNYDVPAEIAKIPAEVNQEVCLTPQEEFVDKTGEFEILFREPYDASLANNFFIFRDFAVLNSSGNICLVELMKNTFTYLFSKTDDDVAAIDTHCEFPYLLVAYKNGRLSLFNYETYEQVITSVLPKYEEPRETKEVKEEPDEDSPRVIEPPRVTCLKYSPLCLHLAVGKSNGEVWLLKPIKLESRQKPMTISNKPIEKITFSADCLQMAYYNTDGTLYLYYYAPDSGRFVHVGKIRAHYKPITDMIFYPDDPFQLCTIGEDRVLNQYNNDTRGDYQELKTISSQRVDQAAVPLSMLFYPKIKYNEAESTRFLLVSDNEYKYKIINDQTGMIRSVTLGPAYGCYKDNPVRKMEFLPESEYKYMVFMSKKHFGLQILPADGNPYKFISCLAHSQELIDFAISNNGKYVFTFGKNERTVFMWETRTKGVDLMHHLGGTSFEPYYCLIEGGKTGFLFQEMQDLFFYMQILHIGENSSLPRRISDKVAISELPDLMRACGFYPTEYEIETLLVDIRYRNFDETRVLVEEVSFEEFFKLFINHKPAYGYSLETLQKHFNTFIDIPDEPFTGSTSREEFLESLTITGEPFSIQQINKCMGILLGESGTDESGEITFEFVPEDIDFKTFRDDILGIDMERTNIAIEESSQYLKEDEFSDFS